MGTTLQKSSGRNVTLDMMKLLAAYFVIFIHNKFFGDFGLAVDSIARFAVPLFFVSSGYFCLNNSTDKIKAKAIRIAKMFLWVTVMYHFVNLAFFVMQGKNAEIVPYIIGIVKFETIWRFLLTNLPYSSTPLWFLIALVYTYAVHYFVVKFRISDKLMFVISCIIIVLNIICWEFLPIFGIVIPVVNCFFTFGYPFFSLGLFFRKNQDKLRNTKLWVLIALFVAGAAESVVSRLMYEHNELFNGKVPEFLLPVQHTMPPVPELFLGTLMTLFAIVVFTLKYPDIKCPKFVQKLIPCGTYIYLFHRLCGMIVVKGMKFVGVYQENMLMRNIATIGVCILSTIVALVVLSVEKKIKAKKKA